MNPLLETKWHALDINEVFKILGSGERGLTSIEAKKRIKTQGLNQLPEAKVDGAGLIFLRQFQSPLIYILLIGSAAMFLLGEVADSIVIAAVLVVNAIVGAIQEGKARNTLLALKKFVETKAVVIRDGKELIIPDTEVVSGDIIHLQEGDKIPSDARLISAHNLKVDEAALTGESESVRKTFEVIENPELPVLEQKNMVFKGTNIFTGNGLAIVVNTGQNTVIGKIAKDVVSIETEIPLKASIRHLSRLIIVVSGIASLFLFIVGMLGGKTIKEMLGVVISVSVSVIPEGLPIAITIILAAGVWRMSKKKALVKRLQAVEALGQARVIAVDKTGTLTRNEMMVQAVYVGGQNFEVGGSGYEPKGTIKSNGKIIEPLEHSDLMLAGKMATFCANASVMSTEQSDEWKISGDPTEAAMLVLGEKLGFNKNDLERNSPLISEIPFDYSLKYHATVHKDEVKNFLSVVGAPEVILALSESVWHGGEKVKLTDDERKLLTQKFVEFSQRGLRVLAFSYRLNESEMVGHDNIHDLTLVGFFGIRDTLRPEAKEAARRAGEAGIKVVMITGDHQVTAEAIAKEAFIFKKGDISLTGEDIDKLSDKELKEMLNRVSVFARVTPEHKLRIINVYKSRGEIIAMTGDGVNDAPSLVAADLGVAMGKIGTEVAKESADIILLDDNFGSIISAIEEGRSIYKTIKKVVLYLLSTGIGELAVITGSLLLGMPLPLLPVQIIWLNFVTDGFFTAALAMEPKEKDLLSEKFHKPNKYIVDKLMAQRMLTMALPMTVITLIMFQGYYEADLAKAWTMSLTLLAVFQWFNAWNCRTENESVFNSNAFTNKYILFATVAAALSQVLAVYHPLFQKFLHTVPLALSDWAGIIALATSIILVEEIRKYIWRNKKFWSSSVPPLQASRI
ncbi:MAG: HAD-IC family P-type ATPase [Candidatus Zambryskibacteria bacterium]|nr:HAD-IC family P-type ATPase [Candidatus Zambryskibacteria bacterium]